MLPVDVRDDFAAWLWRSDEINPPVYWPVANRAASNASPSSLMCRCKADRKFVHQGSEVADEGKEVDEAAPVRE